MKNKHDELVVLVGARVQKFRVTRGYTIVDLGKRANIAPHYIKDIEAGEHAMNAQTLADIAEALGVTAVDLLNVEDSDLGIIVEAMRTDPRNIEKLRARVTPLVVN